MSRHRNVRSMNYSDEYDGYDDVYGHSVEDDSCISPSDAAFMYDRSSRQTQISAFITEEDDIEEVDEDIEPEVDRRHSDAFRYPQLSDVDEARLRSCLDEIHSVIGDSIPENIVVETVLEKKFDLAKALDALLKSSNQNKTEEPKPQRERNRRSRPVEKDDNYSNQNLSIHQLRSVVENKNNVQLFPNHSGCAIGRSKKKNSNTVKNNFNITCNSSKILNAKNLILSKDLFNNSNSFKIDSNICNTTLKNLYTSDNLKMDSITDSEPEEVLRLDAKYSKAKLGFNACPYDNLKSNGDIGIEVASKYFVKQPVSHDPQALGRSQKYSSDDDSDTEFSNMSLVALAAKHKNYPPLRSVEKSASVSLQIDSPMTTEKTGFVDSSDSSSDIEGSSLFALMRRHKGGEKYLSGVCVYGKQKTEDTDVVDGCTDTKIEPQTRSSQPDQLSVDNSIGLKHEKVNVDEILDKIGNVEITTKFVAAQFSDDSDTDEPLSLMGLALKHAQSCKGTVKQTNQEGSGSADDVRSSKPNMKELQNLVNYHRQHTKSESDRYSFTAQYPSDSLLKKGLENNVSTSLRSLGGGLKDLGFQFSLGGSIPGSFKSVNTSNSSSQASVRMEISSKGLGSFSDINNAYSDPDVSISSRHFHNSFEKNFDSRTQEKNINLSSFYSEKETETLSFDMVDCGINLSCALKKSTSGKNSESLMLEDDVEILDDNEDENIITLLDTLMVDEEVEEEKAKSKKRLLSNSELDESCMIDATHLLNIKVKIRTKRCSSFGKVLCRHWRLPKTPYIRMEKIKTNVIPFDFVEPSPDDVIGHVFKRRL